MFGQTPPINRFVFATGLITISVITVALVVGIFGAMPTTVLSQDKPWKIWTTAFLPESWAFFTKDPGSVSLIALKSDASNLTQGMRIDSLPQSLAANAFGLSREQRAHDTEKALYAARIRTWTDCGGMSNDECIHESAREPAQSLDHAQGTPNLCGRFLLVQSELVPYAYRELSPYENKAQKIAQVEVKC